MTPHDTMRVLIQTRLIPGVLKPYKATIIITGELLILMA